MIDIEDYKSDMYETSRSKDDAKTPLLKKTEDTIEVYDFDEIKLAFCEKYRPQKPLRSCDAYYQGQYDKVLIEFKNAHHFKFKQYMDEIQVKIMDSHMLLAEIVCSNKLKEIRKGVQLLIVYKDNKLDYGSGITSFNNNLCVLSEGSEKEEPDLEKVYADEAEYEADMIRVRDLYKGEFFKDVRFMDETEFREDYLKTGFFEK